MADTENQSEIIRYLADLLSSENPHQNPIPPGLEDDLLRKGSILTLTEISSPEAIAVLGKLASSSPNLDMRNSSLQALRQLAQSGIGSAIDEIYNIALQDHQAAARQIVLTANWKPTRPTIKAIFDWLNSIDNNLDPKVDLLLLTEGFFNDASPMLQSTIINRAEATQYRNWAKLVSILSNPVDGLDGIVDLYPDLSQSEQHICLDYLEKLAKKFHKAQIVLCDLFIEHDDRAARDLALKHGYSPDQISMKALYYFLIGDQQTYQEIDFNHNLLVSAYETGSRALRRRLLSFSRQTGQIQWLNAIQQSTEVRWLADLSDRDWDLAIRNLLDQERFTELWRLAQVAPPVWSAGILLRLRKAQWKPDNLIDRDGFTQLSNLAELSMHKPLELKPAAKLMALSDEILSLALHPSGNLLAAGSSGQPIFIWQLPEGELRFPALVGPASSTRSIQFSLDGELVVAASGDQRVRLFRHQNGQLIKTLEGHKGLIRAMALHPNGRMLVTTSFDGWVRLWRFPIGTLVKSVNSAVREMFAAQIFSKGDLLATGGAGDQVTIWGLPDCNRLRALPVDPHGILHLAATPASDLLAVADRSRVISIWNAVNGNLVHTFPVQDEPIAGLHFHPNEQILISASTTGSFKLWNLNSGSALFSFEIPHSKINATCLSADGQTFASADQSGAIHLWSLSTFVWLHTPYQPGIPLPIDQIAHRLVNPSTSPSEKNWLRFIESLWKWIRRFEIEIGEPLMIELGEFDIEL